MDQNSIIDILGTLIAAGNECTRCASNYQSFTDDLRGHIRTQLKEIAATTSNPGFPAICPDMSYWINSTEKEIYHNAKSIDEYLQGIQNFMENSFKHLSEYPCKCQVHLKFDMRYLVSNRLQKIPFIEDNRLEFPELVDEFCRYCGGEPRRITYDVRRRKITAITEELTAADENAIRGLVEGIENQAFKRGRNFSEYLLIIKEGIKMVNNRLIQNPSRCEIRPSEGDKEETDTPSNSISRKRKRGHTGTKLLI